MRKTALYHLNKKNRLQGKQVKILRSSAAVTAYAEVRMPERFCRHLCFCENGNADGYSSLRRRRTKTFICIPVNMLEPSALSVPRRCGWFF